MDSSNILCGRFYSVFNELIPYSFYLQVWTRSLSCWAGGCPAFANSVDPDQLASKKPTDLDLHCLPFSMWIYINNLDQVFWLAENFKRVWHLNLFSRTRVKILSNWWCDIKVLALISEQLNPDQFATHSIFFARTIPFALVYRYLMKF